MRTFASQKAGVCFGREAERIAQSFALMKLIADLLDPTKCAVVIIDVQNDFVHPDGKLAKGGASVDSSLAMLPRLQNLIEEARKAGVLVIFVQTIHEAITDSPARRRHREGKGGSGTCAAGTWGAEFTSIQPRGDEPVVVKHRYSAFINSRLEAVLHSRRIESLIVAGVATNVCVESTVRDGFMHDYNIVLVADCTAAYSREEHEMALRNIAGYFGFLANANEIIDQWSAVPV